MGSNNKNKNGGFRRVKKPVTEDLSNSAGTASSSDAIPSDGSSAASSKLSVGQDIYENERRRRAERRSGYGGSRGSKGGSRLYNKTNVATLIMFAWLVFYVGNEYTGSAASARVSAIRGGSSKPVFKTREERDAYTKKTLLNKAKAISESDFKAKTGSKKKAAEDEDEEDKDEKVANKVKEAADYADDSQLESLASGSGTDLWQGIVSGDSTTTADSATTTDSTGTDSTVDATGLLLATNSTEGTAATDLTAPLMIVGATSNMTTNMDGQVMQSTDGAGLMQPIGDMMQATDGTLAQEGTGLMQTTDGMMQTDNLMATRGQVETPQSRGTDDGTNTGGMTNQDGTQMMEAANSQMMPMQQTGTTQDGTQMMPMQQNNGMQQFNGMQQNIMQQNSMQQFNGMQQNGMQQFNGMQQNGMKQNGMQQIGMQQTDSQMMPMQQTGMQQQTGMDQTGMQTGMQQTDMQQTGMQTTSGDSTQGGQMMMMNSQGNTQTLNGMMSDQQAVQMMANSQQQMPMDSNGMQQTSSQMIGSNNGAMNQQQQMMTGTQSQSAGYESNENLITGPGYSNTGAEEAEEESDEDDGEGDDNEASSLETATGGGENEFVKDSFKKAFARQDQSKTEALIKELNTQIVENPNSYQPDQMQTQGREQGDGNTMMSSASTNQQGGSMQQEQPLMNVQDTYGMQGNAQQMTDSRSMNGASSDMSANSMTTQQGAGYNNMGSSNTQISNGNSMQGGMQQGSNNQMMSDSTMSGNNMFSQSQMSGGTGMMASGGSSSDGNTMHTMHQMPAGTSNQQMQGSGNSMQQVSGSTMSNNNMGGQNMIQTQGADQMTGNGNMMQQQDGMTQHQGGTMMQQGTQSETGSTSQHDFRYPQQQLQQNRRRLLEIPPNFPQQVRDYEDLTAEELYKYVDAHPKFSNLMNVDEALPFNYRTQVPYFWHIHKSGGTTLKHILACLGMTQTRRGKQEGCSDQDEQIQVCPPEYGNLFVNADASSPPGIARIANFGLSNLEVPNLVVDSSRFYEALDVFTPVKKGRMFVLLRDPMDRAFSKYYYNQVATWERNFRPEIANMTVVEYAQSKHCLDNWITRRLVHKMDMTQRVTDGDFRLAKEIIRRKALIMLTEAMDHSGYYFTQYFGIDITPHKRFCVDKYAKDKPINQNPHQLPSRDSAEWNAMQEKHLYDIELYRYAVDRCHTVQAKFLQDNFGALRLPAPLSPDDSVLPDEDDY